MGPGRRQFHQKEVMNQTRLRSTGDVSLSLFWIGLGLFFLWFARDIPQASFTSDGDPGPRAFPQWLGLALIVGGIWELIRQRLGHQASAERTDDEDSHSLRPLNALIVLVAVGLYIPAVSWIGFSVATLILVTALLRFLGSRWWISATVAFSLVVLIQLLFGYGFNVPLPTNHWGLVLPGDFLF